MNISKKHAKLAGIVAVCLLAIACIWLFCANIGPKEQQLDVSKQEQAVKPAQKLDREASRKKAEELTDFSKLNTKPVEDPGF